MRRSLAGLLLAALLLTGCAGKAPVPAPSPAPVQETAGETLPEPMPVCRAYPEAAAALRQALETQAEEVRVTGAPFHAVCDCMDELLASPEYFWCRGYHASERLRGTSLTFRWLWADAAPRRAALAAAVEELLAQTADCGSETERALALYGLLQQRVTYTEREGGLDQTPYAALCEGAAVCRGIADAYTLLLRGAGIGAQTVTGGGHAWCVAVLEGAVYGFDPTWDDMDRPSEEAASAVLYQWFAPEGAAFRASHVPQAPGAPEPGDADAANLYVRNGWVLREPEPGTAYELLKAQAKQDSGVLTLRCETDVIYAALCGWLSEPAAQARLLGGLWLHGALPRHYICEDRLRIVTFFY